jgi:hypothetical protein
MCRLTAFVLVGCFAISVAAQDKTFEIKLKKETRGDRIQVTSTETGDIDFKIELMGQEMGKGEKKTVKLDFIEEVVERDADAKKASKLKRTYTKAERTKDGEMVKLPYHGQAVLIQKKKDKYLFTMGGEELSEDDAEELEGEFNESDIPLDDEDFLPGKPVRLNEVWTLDNAKIAKAFDAGGPLGLDTKTTRITGKLTKVYEKDGCQFGVIALDLKLGIQELRVDGQEIAMKPGSTIVATIILDVCIDGTVHTGTEKGTMKFDLKGNIPNGSLVVSGTAEFDKTTKDLGPK